MIVRADEGPGSLDLSSVEVLVPADIESAMKKRIKKLCAHPQVYLSSLLV